MDAPQRRADRRDRGALVSAFAPDRRGLALIPLILLGLASELSAFERLFGGFTLGPVFIDAPHDLVTLLVVEAAAGDPVAVMVAAGALGVLAAIVA